MEMKKDDILLLELVLKLKISFHKINQKLNITKKMNNNSQHTVDCRWEVYVKIPDGELIPKIYKKYTVFHS